MLRDGICTLLYIYIYNIKAYGALSSVLDFPAVYQHKFKLDHDDLVERWVECTPMTRASRVRCLGNTFLLGVFNQMIESVSHGRPEFSGEAAMPGGGGGASPVLCVNA
jgi:hypothetical protein